MTTTATLETPVPENLTRELASDVRSSRMRFLDGVAPLRPDLYRYCRSLTPTVWDAEDLTQETLLKAFARFGQVHYELRSPKAYLFRIASRTWIDRLRKKSPELLGEASDPAGPEGLAELAPEVRDALTTLATHLPPQERVAVLLKDVFELSLAETANALDTTVGAVKAALHRGRKRLAVLKDAPASAASPREVPSELLERFVNAFNARDLDGLAALFGADAEAEVVGMVHEFGRQQIRDGSLHHTIFDEDGQPRAELSEYLGESVVLIWYTLPAGERLGDVLRFGAGDAEIRWLRYYYFCPELLTEVAETLGHSVHTNGYKYS